MGLRIQDNEAIIEGLIKYPSLGQPKSQSPGWPDWD